MGLESCILCLDTTEHVRNGDYIPTRLAAMCDAATLVAHAKLESNVESTVGIMRIGNGVEVLSSLTSDMNKIMAVCSDLKPQGKMNFSQALSIAALALKHRKTKYGEQRVVVFLGSPVDEESVPKLVKIGKQLKKNGVAVDIVLMGENEHNEARLTPFIDAISKDGNSHIVLIPEGMLPSDILVSSPILGGDGSMGGIGGGGDAFAEYGGVDPNLEPDLALALRASMQDERARLQAEQAKVPTMESATANADSDIVQQALLMSMNAAASESATTNTNTTNTTKQDEPQTKHIKNDDNDKEDDDDDDDEAAMLAAALAMSQQEAQKPPSTSAAAPTTSSQVSDFSDPSFVQQLLADLPGVDIYSPEIQAALNSITNPSAPKVENNNSSSSSSNNNNNNNSNNNSNSDETDEEKSKKQKKNEE